jgi:putative spermidine/putrescine transport system permease protein
MTAVAAAALTRPRPHLGSGLSRLLISTFLLAFVLYVLSPFLAILVTSVAQDWFGGRVLPGGLTLRWFDWAFNVTNLPKVMANSFIIAGLTIAISLVVGLPTAWALGRRRIRARNLLMTLILLPKTVPPITFALGLSREFYNLDLVDTHLGVALAHATLALPFVVLIMSATFEGLDERVLEAGRVCGGSWLRNLVHLVLPMAMPGLMAAVLFTFVTSFNEFTLTLVTYGPDTLTLTVQTYLAIGDGFLEVASAISVILLVPSVLLLILIQRQIRPEAILGGVKGL